MNDYDSVPTPIEGVIFERSGLKTLAWLIANVLMFGYGLLLTVSFIRENLGFVDMETKETYTTVWGFLVGLLFVFFAIAMVILLVRSYWVKRRIVIGEDRFQVLERSSGEDVVVLQILFKNIANIKYEGDETGREVRVYLESCERPGAYSQRKDFHMAPHVEYGRVCFSGGYKGGPKEIKKALIKAVKQWEQTLDE